MVFARIVFHPQIFKWKMTVSSKIDIVCTRGHCPWEHTIGKFEQKLKKTVPETLL